MNTRLERLLGESHERCPTGKHWNEDHHACEEIPSSIQAGVHEAGEWSKNAESGSRSADWMSGHIATHGTGGVGVDAVRGNHRRAASGHSTAKRAHQRAAHVLKQAGFHDLAKEHSDKAFAHSKHQAAHIYQSTSKPHTPHVA